MHDIDTKGMMIECGGLCSSQGLHKGMLYFEFDEIGEITGRLFKKRGQFK